MSGGADPGRLAQLVRASTLQAAYFNRKLLAWLRLVFKVGFYLHPNLHPRAGRHAVRGCSPFRWRRMMSGTTDHFYQYVALKSVLLA